MTPFFSFVPARALEPRSGVLQFKSRPRESHPMFFHHILVNIHFRWIRCTSGRHRRIKIPAPSCPDRTSSRAICVVPPSFCLFLFLIFVGPLPTPHSQDQHCLDSPVRPSVLAASFPQTPTLLPPFHPCTHLNTPGIQRSPVKPLGRLLLPSRFLACSPFWFLPSFCTRPFRVVPNTSFPLSPFFGLVTMRENDLRKISAAHSVHSFSVSLISLFLCLSWVVYNPILLVSALECWHGFFATFTTIWRDRYYSAG